MASVPLYSKLPTIGGRPRNNPELDDRAIVREVQKGATLRSISKKHNIARSTHSRDREGSGVGSLDSHEE